VPRVAHAQTDTEDPFIGPDNIRNLTGYVFPRSNDPAATGGFADVYLASWNGERVAAKAVRLFTNNTQTMQRLRRVRCELSYEERSALLMIG
jgi:hypothetical protein